MRLIGEIRGEKGVKNIVPPPPAWLLRHYVDGSCWRPPPPPLTVFLNSLSLQQRGSDIHKREQGYPPLSQKYPKNCNVKTIYEALCKTFLLTPPLSPSLPPQLQCQPLLPFRRTLQYILDMSLSKIEQSLVFDKSRGRQAVDLCMANFMLTSNDACLVISSNKKHANRACERK